MVNAGRRVRLGGLVVLISLQAALAGDFLFVNPAYLSETQNVIHQANEKAPAIFREQPALLAAYDNVQKKLSEKVSDTQRALLFKKVKADSLNKVKDEEFSMALVEFKNAINAMAEASEEGSLEKLLPSYHRWNGLETAVVKAGVDQRLAAFQTRFGPDSEPINIIEYVISQKFLPGEATGPAAWEPILRVSAVQITSRGTGVTSAAQAGLNYYFVNGAPPKPLKWLGVSNHVGLAGSVQYLDKPGILELKGRPSFGAILHFDRKELGLAWDPTSDRWRLTLGYSFQFVPLAL